MTTIPKYGIVRWRDAVRGNGKVRKDRLTKNAPIREDIGWLFQDAEGSIQVVYGRVVSQNVQQERDFTLIPVAWLVEIIALEPAKVVKPAEIVAPGAS